jgi:tRNA (cytidine/uridine-2'-O-)-methyltransferase
MQTMTKLHIVLFQPDIAQNVGAIIRIAACFDCSLHIIEPCGFPFDLKKIKISAMDYLDKITMKRHNSWQDFLLTEKPEQLSLLTTKTDNYLDQYKFLENSYLVFGRESAGVTAEVANSCPQKFKIPIAPNTRSLNLAISVGIAVYTAKASSISLIKSAPPSIPTDNLISPGVIPSNNCSSGSILE